ncbi:MAG TPA: endonuclease domain-containing protein [Xanthobacteraceae bacterium]|nr:endonuclease domain-containing protein [Xanthobacteraceae bacterium]
MRRNARRQRIETTRAEQVMWLLLRGRRFQNFKFRRQVPFQNYILDFVCFERRLVVEIDGGQHSESKTDVARDSLLASEGFAVARYWNNEVLQNEDGVQTDLLKRLQDLTPHPPRRYRGSAPSPTRGEGSTG